MCIFLYIKQYEQSQTIDKQTYQSKAKQLAIKHERPARGRRRRPSALA